jgi:hypothetical protein
MFYVQASETSMGDLATIIIGLKASTSSGYLFDDAGVNATSVHKRLFCH